MIMCVKRAAGNFSQSVCKCYNNNMLESCTGTSEDEFDELFDMVKDESLKTMDINISFSKKKNELKKKMETSGI